MNTVYYRPPDILHWIGSSSDQSRDRARRKGRDIPRATGEEGIAQGFKQAASAVMDFGRASVAEIFCRRAQNLSYVLDEEWFEQHSGGKRKRVLYKSVHEIVNRGGDKYSLLFDGGGVTVKPIAHLVGSRLRVPIGWLRNGMEVPFSVLVEELAARCGLDWEK